MKISELTPEIVKDYCGISDGDSDTVIEQALIPAAIKFIAGYTGLSEEEIDKHDDLTTACMVLVNDMYTNRDYTLSLQKQVNPCVKTILGMYAKNYI